MLSSLQGQAATRSSPLFSPIKGLQGVAAVWVRGHLLPILISCIHRVASENRARRGGASWLLEMEGILSPSPQPPTPSSPPCSVNIGSGNRALMELSIFFPLAPEYTV